MSYSIEPADDGRCDIHHGIVKAVGQIPRAHATSYAYEDGQGRIHSGVQWDHHVEREVWIAASGEPDRRFILGEGFGVLPGHELVLACAPGCIIPFRAHNLSTDQLFDVFQPPIFSRGAFVFECMLIAGLLAAPIWFVLWAVWYDSWSSQYGWPPKSFAAAVYGGVLALVLLVAVPFAGKGAAQRQRARRVVDTRLAAFEAARRHRALPGRSAGRRAAITG